VRLDGLGRSLQEGRKRVAASILLAGVASAVVLYLAAAPPAGPPGERPEDSKRYLRQMEVYGGSANVLASEIREWFEGLWHGRTLAFTVAGLSALLALFVAVALTPLPAATRRTRTEGRSGPDS